MNTVGLSDQIRLLVKENYVKPAVQAGNRRLSIKVRDILTDVGKNGFPQGRTPVICQVLQGQKLLKENGLEIERVDGPPSKQSPTVVVHYRLPAHPSGRGTGMSEEVALESPAARAKRLTDKLRGLLKNELAEYGGAEGFIRWIRSDEKYPG